MTFMDKILGSRTGAEMQWSSNSYFTFLPVNYSRNGFIKLFPGEQEARQQEQAREGSAALQ
jgi:hypothetical protein